MVDTTAKAKVGRRQWIGLLVLALPGLLVTMDLTVLFLAVPSLTADLAPSSTELLWITDIYGFLIAGVLDAATGAFAQGMHTAAVVGIGLLLATAALVAVGLRAVPTADPQPAEAPDLAPATA